MLKFNTVYIEKDASMLDNIEYENLIEINHYKDVFCRPRQDYQLQHDNQNLILAKRRDNFLYKGAKPCQNFGYDNFYYSSCVMNCVCDCEYCYLKGMYPSGNLVVFTNLKDYFDNIDEGKYICISYDTDLFPLESTLGYIKKWCEFAKNKNITLEVRTKCKNLDVWNMEVPDNVIFAFSVNPQSIINEYEHKTSSLKARLENICVAQENGFRTRLCIDPIIYTKNWKKDYEELISNIDFSNFEDVSVGSFRISQSYLKNMRKNNSKLPNFPFKNIDGYFQYPFDMEEYVVSLLSFPKEKIYLWK